MAVTLPNLWTQAAAALSINDRLSIDMLQQNATKTIDDVLAIAQEKQNECLKKRWRYKNAEGQVIILRDVFAKVVKWIDTFKQIGDTIVQYDPVHAALPWAGVRLLLQVVVNDNQIQGAMADGVELVSNIITRHAVVEMLYLQRPSRSRAQLESAILKLYSAILVYLNKSVRYYEQSTLSIPLSLAMSLCCKPMLDRKVLANCTPERVSKSIVQTPEQGVEQHLRGIVAAQADVNASIRLVAAEYSEQTYEDVHQVIDSLARLTTRSDSLASQQKKLEGILNGLDEPINRTATQLKDLHDSLTNSERAKIFSWLSCVPYLKHHRAKIRELLPGSCQWLYQKTAYREWRQSSISSILWLHGIPGSGKSMLISSIVESMRIENDQNSNPPPLAYFYCARNSGEPERSDPDEIMRCILEQLSSSDVDVPIRAPVVAVYKEKEKEAKGRQIETLVLEETLAIVLQLLEDNPATIIIDALDECDPARRQHLLLVLSKLIQKSASLLKILVSSRDDRDIVHRLANSPNLYISASDNGKDIRDYVRTQVNQAIEEDRLLCGEVSESLRGHIISALTSQAQGMFRLVSLHIDTLCNPELVKTEGNIYYTLERLPRALKDSYGLIFKQIIDSQYPNPDIASRAMKWLICAQRQLKTSEFIAAISVDISGKCFDLGTADVLSVCCNLVVHDSEQDTFRFAHLSVREYLESLPEYGSSRAHAFALERCLIASLKLLNTSSESRSLDRTFSYYACEWWHKHYGWNDRFSSPFQLDEHLRRSLLDFFFYNCDKGSSFSQWILDPDNTLAFNGYEERISALRHLVTKDLGSNRQHIELAASTPPRNHSEVVVNIMLTDLLFSHRADKDHLGPALPLAVREKKEAITLMVLRKGANVNEHDKLGKTALSYAIDFEDEELLSKLLERGANLQMKDNNGVADLYRAAEAGYELAVRRLLQYQASVDSRNSNGLTPLMAAATRGHVAVVELLLENGADMNTSGYLWESTLHKVATNGYTAMARLLLDRGADVNFLDYRERTALHTAAESGVEDLVQLLLERGAQISKKDFHGILPIEIAAARGDVALVKILLQKEEEPDAKNEMARKAFSKAFSQGNLEVVKFLIDLKFRPTECINIDELLQLATQSQSGGHNAILKLVLENWWNIDALDNTGQTLLRRAIKLGHSHLVRVLLQQQANTESRDLNGETVLQIAAGEGKADIVRQLLEARAEVGAATPVSGYTALHRAAEAGYLDTVKVLMEAGADVNAELSDGQTALHLAAAKGHDFVFAFLLEFI